MTARIKLTGYGRGSDWSRSVGVVNDVPNDMLCLTRFLVFTEHYSHQCCTSLSEAHIFVEFEDLVQHG